MKSQISNGAVMIALRYFPTGGRSFEPGDKFPYQDLGFTDRRLMQMTDSRHIGPLTRENYARALQIQGPDFIGKGFTRDGLVGMGILDAKGKATRAAPAPEPNDGWSPPVDQYQAIERYGDIWLAGAKRGVATRYDLFDLDGNKLNPGATLNGLAKAKEAADQIAKTAAEQLKKGPQPLFPDFPLALADWSAEQLAEFDAWYASLPADDDTPHVLLTAAAERFKQLQVEESQKKALYSDFPADLADWSPEQVKTFDDWFFAQEAGFDPEDGLLAPPAAKRFAGLDTYAAMDDAVLIAILTDEGLTPSGSESHRELVELCLMIPPVSTEGGDSDTPDAEEQKDGDDGGDIQSGTGGSGEPGSTETG